MRQLIAIVGLAWPLLATAQTNSPAHIRAASGDSIRLVMHGGTLLLGTLLRQTSDSVALRRTAGQSPLDTVISLSAIESVQAKLRRHTVGSALTGLGIGLLSGAVAGGIAAHQSIRDCQGSDCGLAYLAVPIFGLVGGGVGLVVGGVRTSERWEGVWRPSATPD